LDSPNDSEDDCVAENEFNIEQNNGIEIPKYPEQQDVSAVPNFQRLVWPTRNSKRQAVSGRLRSCKGVARLHYVTGVFSIPITNSIFIESKYSHLSNLFLSSSYPKTQPLARLARAIASLSSNSTAASSNSAKSNRCQLPSPI